MQKRGQGLPVELIIIAALALVVLILVYSFLTRGGRTASEFFNQEEFSIKHESCKLQGQRLKFELESSGQSDRFKQIDQDNDGFPSSCEYCLGGDDRIPSTRGIPNACDNPASDVKKGLKAICESIQGKFNKDIPQCDIRKSQK